MNSLNLISSRVIGQNQPPLRPRSRSQGDLLKNNVGHDTSSGRSYSSELLSAPHAASTTLFPDLVTSEPTSEDGDLSLKREDEDEKEPLLAFDEKAAGPAAVDGWPWFVKSLTQAITTILAALATPVVYLARCFRDRHGRFSAVPHWPPYVRVAPSQQSHPTEQPNASDEAPWQYEKPKIRALQESRLRQSYSSDSLNTSTTDSDKESLKPDREPAKKAKREKAPREESETRRSSIRIKEQNDLVLKRRKQKKAASPLADTAPLTVDTIKSPTSPSPSLRITRYPHAPQPPRPLTPRRQPSYANLAPRAFPRGGGHGQQKTLILDLDETLIHSLAKGGRMSSGHMVEVKLNAPVALAPPLPGQAAPPLLGPQHPILYYVHKRPHCDEFLRKVSKWFKLVVFTASVQEYADPVIDWLEQERKYFVGRYYRQHCTFRNGAYIKDLSSIEPDLSQVMILDNSPVSYIFHEDNAIPIEGWINDPTDNDLLHLIPMLEALQYATDVRALLALRRGEAEVAS